MDDIWSVFPEKVIPIRVHKHEADILFSLSFGLGGGSYYIVMHASIFGGERSSITAVSSDIRFVSCLGMKPIHMR